MKNSGLKVVPRGTPNPISIFISKLAKQSKDFRIPNNFV